MWCVEQFKDEEQLRLYSSKAKYEGEIKAFKSKEEAIDYLYRHGKTEDRTECPNCHHKWKVLDMRSRHLTKDIHCPNCGKPFARL